MTQDSSGKPPTYPESVPEKSCRTPEEIWALAKPGEFSTLTAEEFEAFQKYGAPKNYGHVAEKCAWCLDPAAPGKRHCQRCLALAFPDSAATENPVVYVIGPEIPSPAPENQAVLAERERCSKVVREWARGCNNFCTSKVLNQVYGSALNDLAETLRHPEWADATTP